MPTEALDSILYRELSKVAAKDAIDIISPLLQELVNHATKALARCATSASGKVDEDVAVLALYRQGIEVTDGIEVLISQSCPSPAIPLLRTSFETLLSTEYILEKEGEYTRRSLSWLVGYIHQRLDMYERLDPSTPKGQDFQRAFKNDKQVSSITLPSPTDARKAITNLQSMLNKPHIQPIESEYQSHRRRPKWHQLFGGPPNLRELARYLRRGAQYEILYRHWSSTTHAESLLPFIDRTKAREGESAIGRLRDPGQIREVASYSATFMLNMTRLVLTKFRPGEDLASWYKREVRDRFLRVVGAA
jgi:hypothetical protein